MNATKYDNYCNRLRAEHGGKFSPAELAPQFVEAFNRGDRFRVKVRFIYGATHEDRWGYVSATTGWRPCFLLIRPRGQIGSSETLGANDQIIDSHWIE